MSIIINNDTKWHKGIGSMCHFFIYLQKPTSNLIIEIKMKTGFILVIASALLVANCSQTKYPELTDERFQELVASLPDHYMKLDTASYTVQARPRTPSSW